MALRGALTGTTLLDFPNRLFGSAYPALIGGTFKMVQSLFCICDELFQYGSSVCRLCIPQAQPHSPEKEPQPNVLWFNVRHGGPSQAFGHYTKGWDQSALTNVKREDASCPAHCHGQVEQHAGQAPLNGRPLPSPGRMDHRPADNRGFVAARERR